MINSMCKKYGELIIPKGCTLYYTNRYKFTIPSKSESPMIHCYIHPSERENIYIGKLELKRDISLFFAIDFYKRNNKSIPQNIMKDIIQPEFFIKNEEQVRDYQNYLSNKCRENNFDGWIELQRVIKNGDMEICLINDNDLYDITIEEYVKDWKLTKINIDENKNIRYKYFGELYPIFIKNINSELRLNKRYKDFIELFINNTINHKYGFYKSLHVLLKDINIIYHEGDFTDIIWNSSNL